MVTQSMADLEKYKVEYDHESADDLLDTLSFMLLVYSNPDHWKLTYHGEPPHFLGAGLYMNFRPRTFPMDGGRAFAEEMIEKIRRFREQQKVKQSMYCEVYELEVDVSTECSDVTPHFREPILRSVQAGNAPRHEDQHPQQVEFAGGKVASTKIPPIHLIPTVALEKTAERFQLGIERKGDKSWNAISSNQEVLRDLDFLIERTAHIIHHAAKLRDKLVAIKHEQSQEKSNPVDLMKAIDEDDDASAIVWGGMFMQCAVESLRR